jgi:EF hand domain-containing protein
MRGRLPTSLHRSFTTEGKGRRSRYEARLMLLPIILVPLLAAAPAPPITVTGHAWAPFISPMGEPFRARTENDDTLARWFGQADRNHDGIVTTDEMVADAERFFATLDGDHNGEIDPDELAHYEYEIAPDVQVMSKTRRMPGEPATTLHKDEFGNEVRPRTRAQRRERDAQDAAALGIGGALQGAARYGLLNMPEPVAAADTDFNRGISLAEFKQAAAERFELLAGKGAALTLAQLETVRSAALAGARAKRRDNPTDRRVGNPLPSGD